MSRLLGCVLLVLSLCSAAQAAPLKEADVPAPLKPWVGWVLQNDDPRACPPGYQGGERTLCTWPASLRLNLGDAGGSFELETRLFKAGWLELPGEPERWPQEVRSDGAAAPVTLRDNRPSVWLEAGSHKVQGEFRWSALPESLYLPAGAGLVTLSVNGAARPHPSRDARGHVWLGKAASGETGGRHLSLKVFRLIDDDIPARIVTRIDIEAAGEVRDEVIGPALSPGFVPLLLSGDLPARLADDGRLHVQVRPGVWSLELTARAAAPLAELALPQLAEPWPAQEVWSFRAHDELRVVETGDAPAIDPRQTQMPEGWYGYPAFLLEAGGKLSLAEKQRGNPQPPPDQLSLDRQLWLDFDGGGYTVQDRLGGRLNSHWRLESAAPLALGRAQVDGEPQLITRIGEAAPGVEVRHGALNLEADSRIDAATRRLPVTGWNTDLQGVQITLHLPPAWRLFAVSGADNVPDTWIARWSLLDLFVVLIASVAAFRLFGYGWGAVTLLALALSWHEPGAPRWAWLNLIAAIALVRALPDSLKTGALPAWLDRYRWASAVIVLLIALPFAIQQVRLSLYPQLENQMGSLTYERAREEVMSAQSEMAVADSASYDMAAAPAPMEEAGRQVKLVRGKADSYAGSVSANVSQQSIQRMDPNVLTQTGPGLPNWTWRSATLSWSGPVTADQEYRLWLLPPWLTRILQVLSVILIFVVLARWMDLKPRLPAAPARSAGTALALALGLALTAMPDPAQAQDFAANETPGVEPQPPTPDLLDELKRRLLAPPECSPDCVQIARLGLSASEDGALTLRLRIDALAPSALPLPLPLLAAGEQGRVWQPAQVLLDGTVAALRRESDGTLWIAVPAGRHEAVVSGSLAGFSQLQLPMPLKPRRIDSELRGWLLSGVNEQGVAGDALQLLRSAPGGETAREGGADSGQALPPLLIVTRTLRMGLDWDVETEVQRLGVTHTPVLAQVPLLAGEQITGEAVRVRDGAVQLSLAPGQTRATWTSRLPVSEKLSLKAPDSADAVEVWQFDVSPLWHAEFDGLPPISHQSDDWWLPRFQPWPGETLNLSVSRPAGVQGRTLTLDETSLKTLPAQRATDYELSFRLRASQGGTHALTLPEGLELQGLTIDGAAQTARQEGGKLILPLRPGPQTYALSLRAADSIGTLLRTPALDLGLPGVNTRLDIELPQDRWILSLGGPRLGPAVLFWGVLAVLLVIAYALGRLRLTPLKGWQWALLMIGLSQIPVWAAAVVAGWLIALGQRGRRAAGLSHTPFNLAQIALVLLTLFALGLLFSAVAKGLLGAPDMQIAGNDSYGNSLHWFADRQSGALPQAWVLSVPLWIYRVLMLLWALWLANALLAWLRWGWEQFTTDAIWKKPPPKQAPVAQPPA